MRFQRYLTEKLKPSQFRKYVKAWKENGAYKMFDKLFGKKHRLYEPYEGEISFIETSTSIKIKKFLDILGWNIKDYRSGIAVNIDKKEKKISKILQDRIKKTKEKGHGATYVEEILKEFINDKSRALSKSSNYLICYSRHAYDIAGMSTDRGWKSCMTLPGDKNDWHSLVGNEASEGCLIAYLIKEDDKNLQHPIGRVMIKPYAHIDNYDLQWVVGNKGYGTTPRKFLEQVEEWVEKHLNGEEPEGLYNLSSRMESSDFPFAKIGKNKVMMIRKWVDMLKCYDEFNNAEVYSPGVYKFMVKNEFLFGLQSIFGYLSNEKPKDVIKDLVLLSEKDELGSEKFIAKIMKVFDDFHQSKEVLLPVRAVGLVIKLIQKDLEREIFNETYSEIKSIIDKRKLIRAHDVFNYHSTDDLIEILRLTKPYLDRLYKVYG
jgi:hypothetical protein